MNLKNKLAHMRGQNAWVKGYQIPVANDGIAYNVPAQLASVLLTNPEVWEQVPGTSGPVLVPGFRPASPIAPQQLAPQQPAQVRTIEIPLVPKSLEYLEALSGEDLYVMAEMFGLDPASSPASPPALARAIIAQADEQLVAQIHAMLESKKALPEYPVEPAEAGAAEQPADSTPEVAEAPEVAPVAKKRVGRPPKAVAEPKVNEQAAVSTIED